MQTHWAIIPQLLVKNKFHSGTLIYGMVHYPTGGWYINLWGVPTVPMGCTLSYGMIPYVLMDGILCSLGGTFVNFKVPCELVGGTLMLM